MKRPKRSVTTPQQGTWDTLLPVWLQPPSVMPSSHRLCWASNHSFLSHQALAQAVLSLLHGEPSSLIPCLGNSHSSFQSQLKCRLLLQALLDFPESRPYQPLAHTSVLAFLRSPRLDLEKLVFNCKLRSFLLGKLATTYSLNIPCLAGCSETVCWMF